MLTLILKSLTACNLRCSYCSVGSKECVAALTEKQMLEALEFFVKYAHEKGENQVNIIFHGGEPMLLPAEQYDICIRNLIQNHSDFKFRFCMQTNGTILSEKYLNLFRTHRIHIGISLDGSQEIHDKQRLDISGAGTYKTVMEHIHVLQENQIPVSALMVLTKPALLSSLDFLKEFALLKIPLKINPLMSLGEAVKHPELFLEPGEYGRYLAKVFEYIAEENLDLFLSPLDELLYNILDENNPRGCHRNPHCHRRFLCVGADKQIYPCGRFADVYEHKLGTIETGITKEGERILDMLEARRTTNLPTECQTCQYLKYCYAGCSSDQAWDKTRMQPSANCEDIKYLIHYLKTKGMEILRRQLLEERVKLLRSQELPV